MKKTLSTITVLLAILATTGAFAQEINTDSADNREKFRFGVKAGMNVSNVYDEEGSDFVADNTVGFVGGAFFAIPIGKYLGFQPEVLYSQKGFEAKGNTLLGDYNFTRTSTYLDIPLQLQIKPAAFITLLAGPQYSYLLKTKNSINGNTSTTQEEDINSDNYKKNILGFVVGADINLDKFIISGRAGWDISKSDSNGDSTKPRYKNQVLQLTLGYAF
jgi:hypothetical protein